VLVGFVAAGKSTVGRLLAARLGWDLVDFDDRVRERTGLAPGALIRERGEPALREVEAALTAELADARDVVLVPGGGWGARPEMASSLGPGTVRVWLRLSAAEAVRRAAADGVDRPLLGDAEDHAGRLRTAGSLLAARTWHYAAAEEVVDVEEKEPAAVVDEILERLDTLWGDDDR
jgi:shikimate kinase